MPEDSSLTLRQVDQARADFTEIADNLDFIMGRLSRLPTCMELARLVLLVTLSTAALVLLVGLLAR